MAKIASSGIVMAAISEHEAGTAEQRSMKREHLGRHLRRGGLAADLFEDHRASSAA